MPPETLLLSVVVEQSDIFQDICKAAPRNVTTGTIVVVAAVYSQFTLGRQCLMKGSGQRGTWILVNKIKGRVGFRFCIQ